MNVGDKIPTEDELCKIFNISWMTVWQAVEGLVNSGKFLRQKGRGKQIASNKRWFSFIKNNGNYFSIKQYTIEYIVGLYRGDRYKFRLYLKK